MDVGGVGAGGGGHVEARGRAVDDLTAGHHGVAVDRRQPAVQVDGQDGEQAGAVVRGRVQHARAADERVGVPALAAAVGEPVGGHLHRSDGAHRGLGRQHHAGDGVLLAGVDEGAVGAHRAHDVHVRRVARVDLGEHGAARRGHDGGTGRAAVRGLRRDLELARDDQQTPIVLEDLRAAALERQRAEQRRRGRAHVDGAQRPVHGREHRRAVGLDHVGLVDAGFLHVGARSGVGLALALAALAGGRGRGRGGPAHRRVDRLAARAVALGVGARVAGQRLAGRERPQARVGGGPGGDRQQAEDREDEQRSGHGVVSVWGWLVVGGIALHLPLLAGAVPARISRPHPARPTAASATAATTPRLAAAPSRARSATPLAIARVTLQA